MMTSETEKPAVSVIIPTYNRCRMVKEAVQSVLSQNFSGFELIVVDDGSTDATVNVLRPFRHDLLLIRQPNRGVSAARNSGITAARGDLIAFLDSDDIWLPGKLARQADFFNSHPKALLCQTEELWLRNGRRVNPKKRHQKRSGMIFKQSLQLCLVSPSAVMMRRKLFNAVGLFDENLPACEDYDLWLRTTCRFPVHLIDTPLMVKRGGHDDQLSKMPGLDRFRIRALEKILVGGALSPRQRTAVMAVLEDKCAIYSGGCMKRGRREEARYYQALPDRLKT